eukprot:3003061-Prymnesium_polylepis.2
MQRQQRHRKLADAAGVLILNVLSNARKDVDAEDEACHRVEVREAVEADRVDELTHAEEHRDGTGRVDAAWRIHEEHLHHRRRIGLSRELV